MWNFAKSWYINPVHQQSQVVQFPNSPCSWVGRCHQLPSSVKNMTRSFLPLMRSGGNGRFGNWTLEFLGGFWTNIWILWIYCIHQSYKKIWSTSVMFFFGICFFCWNFWMRPPLGAVWWWKRWGKAVLVEQYLQVNMTKPQKCIYFFSEIRDPSKSSCICIKFDPHPHKSGKLIEWPFWNHGGKSSEWKMYDIDGAGKGATLKVYCINQCFSWEMLQAPASWKLYHSSAGEYLVKPPHYLQKWHISNYQNLSY